MTDHLVIASHAKSRVLDLHIPAHAPVSHATQTMSEAFVASSAVFRASALYVVKAIPALHWPPVAARSDRLIGFAEVSSSCETAPHVRPGRTVHAYFAQAAVDDDGNVGRRMSASANICACGNLVRCAKERSSGGSIDQITYDRWSWLTGICASVFWELIARLRMLVRVLVFNVPVFSTCPTAFLTKNTIYGGP